jgi:S1-C subfamily serine protease
MKRFIIAGARVTAVALSLGLAVVPPLEAQRLREQFRAASPSVVIVRTIERTPSPTPNDGFVSASGLGSGVLVSTDGKVLTAAHVVQTADRVAVEFANGVIVPARVVASEPRADVALLQLQRVPAGAVAARIADSDSLQVGDDVFIIGAPYGLSHSLSVGHVSGRHDMRRTVRGVPIEVLQTDAAVNVGNSGGPMFNTEGAVVGIVSQILSQSGGFEGVGFAVSSKVARDLMLSQEPFWSGVDAYLLTDGLAAAFNVPQSAGLLIQHVADGSPAAAMGLRPSTVRAAIGDDLLLVGGDIVLSVAGIAVADDGAVLDRMQRALGQGAVDITVLRAGKVVTLKTR